MSFSKKEISYSPSVQREPTIKEIIRDYLEKHERCRRTELYPLCSRNEVTVRKSIREMIRRNEIKEDMCECGHTGYLKLVKPKQSKNTSKEKKNK